MRTLSDLNQMMTLPNGILKADVRIKYYNSVNRKSTYDFIMNTAERAGGSSYTVQCLAGYLTRGLTSVVSTCLMARFIEERIIRFVEAGRIMRQFTNPKMKQE